MLISRLISAAALCLVATAGCSRHRSDQSSPALAEPVDSLVLEVENHNWSDVVVSVIHDGRINRLTQVTAGTKASLPIPPHLIGEAGTVQLVVHPIGGRDDYRSETISVRTGSVVRLTVESRVTRSSVAVF